MANQTLEIAKKYFYEKKYKSALPIFIKQKEYYGAGLCSLLLKNEKDAHKYWSLNRNCPGCIFGLISLGYINLKPEKVPSFFQTRAFLEVFLNLLLENKLIEWAQNFVNCYEYFYKGNPESYKFIARALFANGYADLSNTFLKRSLDIFWADPEAMLILAQNHYLLKDIKEAMAWTNKIIEITPNYYPAILFKKALEGVK